MTPQPLSDWASDRLMAAVRHEMEGARLMGHEVLGGELEDGQDAANWISLCCTRCAARSTLNISLASTGVARPVVYARLELSINECALERLHEAASLRPQRGKEHGG